MATWSGATPETNYELTWTPPGGLLNVFFNRKRPDPKEVADKAEAWMQSVRRTILSNVSCWFTFKILIWSVGEDQVAVRIMFTASDKVFETSFKKDPEKFAKKEIVPWIQQNGQHV